MPASASRLSRIKIVIIDPSTPTITCIVILLIEQSNAAHQRRSADWRTLKPLVKFSRCYETRAEIGGLELEIVHSLAIHRKYQV